VFASLLPAAMGTVCAVFVAIGGDIQRPLKELGAATESEI
jgi:hypothetical protein